ncbi:hypothetical protein BH24ACT3_BH24ACT3_06530 [soil metagenome]
MQQNVEPRHDSDRHGERRALEPLLYQPDQLLGRAPIRLRRASDKRRLAFHLVAVLVLVALTARLVLLPHAFEGPVLLTLAHGRGVHAGDLSSLVFLAFAASSLFVVRRMNLALAV